MFDIFYQKIIFAGIFFLNVCIVKVLCIVFVYALYDIIQIKKKNKKNYALALVVPPAKMVSFAPEYAVFTFNLYNLKRGGWV